MEKTSCVYKIVNKVNGSFYIGSAVDFKRRIRRHLLFLKNGNHHSSKLQRSFNKHGEDNFSFEILEIVTTKLIECEQKWIDELKPTYNMTLIAGLNSHLGMKRSDDTKERIRKALTGKKQSPEHVEANRASKLGIKQSEESKRKKSESLSLYWDNVTEVECKKRSEKSKVTRLKNGGYVITDEMKVQISETLKSKNLQSAVSVEIEKYDLDNNLLEIYPSMMKAEIANNFGRGNLYYNLVKNGKQIYKGFIWKLKK